MPLLLNAAKSLLNKSVKGKSSAMSEAKSATFLERLSRQFSIDVTKMKIQKVREMPFLACFIRLQERFRKIQCAQCHLHTRPLHCSPRTKVQRISLYPAYNAQGIRAKKFFSLFTIQNLLMFVLLVAVTWTLLAMCASYCE